MPDTPPQALLAARLKLSPEQVPSLRQALVHKSYVNERGGERHESNERLEFLGDAVLDAAVADELFRRFPHSPEGDLTMMRALLVRKSTLATWGRSLDLGRLVLLGQADERPGEREREALLAQLFEAVVGAVFLDRGYARARALVRRFVVDELREGDLMRRAVDAKSRLQQRSQALYGITPQYNELGAVGPDHDPISTVRVVFGEQMEALGTGRGKRAAEQAAAVAALAELERLHLLDGGEARP